MKRMAFGGGLVVLFITVLIGVMSTVRLSNNVSHLNAKMLFNKSTNYSIVKANMDRGSFQWALNSEVPGRTGFTVYCKTGSGGSYVKKWSGYAKKNQLVGYKYGGSASGFVARWFKVIQTTNLKKTTTTATLYVDLY